MKCTVAALVFILPISCIFAENLVFDVAGTETYTTRIDASCEKIVKNGPGTLTLAAADDAEFAGTVEVNDGMLKIVRIGNLGKPTAIVISPGATLDLSGTETVRGAQPWCPSLTMGGTGCAGATGALVRNRGAAWDRMFQNVTLTEDATVDFGVETSFGYGTLALNGHNFTKRGSGVFQLMKRGQITGEGNIIIEGSTLFENIDMSAGDPLRNAVILRSTLRWWTSRFDKPINWKLRCEAGASVVVEDNVAGSFDDYRLWRGPIETASGVAFTNDIRNSNSAVTYVGDIALKGALALTGKGALRLESSLVSAESLDMRNGYLQLCLPSGSTVEFAGTSQAYGFFEGLCSGSTVSFGGEFVTRFADTLTRLRGGRYTYSGEVKVGSKGWRNTWDVSDGSQVVVCKNFDLGYSITTDSGHEGVFSVRGEGTVFKIQNGASFKVSRTAYTKEIFNISSGATFISPRLTVTTPEDMPTAEFFVNVDGGTIKPTYGYGWLGGSAAKSGYEPTAFTLFEGGMTIDLSECWADNVAGGKDGVRTHSSISAVLACPGEGRRIASISLPEDEAFLAFRYAAIPPIVISGCTGASAFLDLDPLSRQPKGIVVTSKGWGLMNDATAKVKSPDGLTEYVCPIVGEEQPQSEWKGLTVLGASGTALMLLEANTYLGPTVAKAGADVRFMVQQGRPLGSGLIVEKGSTIRFNNTDQSERPITFIQGGGTIQGFSSTIAVNEIRVTTAELMAGEFIRVNGGLVLAAGTVVKVVDPENLRIENFGKARQIVSASTLVLPETGLSGFAVDTGTIGGKPWRIMKYGENGLVLCPPAKGLVVSFR